MGKGDVVILLERVVRVGLGKFLICLVLVYFFILWSGLLWDFNEIIKRKNLIEVVVYSK